LDVRINQADGQPIYLQIVNQVKYLAASGRLRVGDELPPIRVLAERLLINPNTVARAYRELENLGIVEKRKTAGTYVAEGATTMIKRERIKILADRVDMLLAEAHRLDVPFEDLLALVNKRRETLQFNEDLKP
jgi:GntR family transcriptional regulator